MIDVSVIIPMYNGERTIERCLDSILNQSYKCNYEILIINDESKDSSKDIVERYINKNTGANIKVIDKKNGGAASARNEGIKVAKGYWIALLDCDDEWLPNKLTIQMDILKRHPNIDCLGGNLQNQKTKILGLTIDRLSKIHQWKLLIIIYPQTSTVVMKKDVINEIGAYDESLRYYEDGEFWLRIASKKEFWFSPEQVTIYDQGKAGFGISGMTARLNEMQDGNRLVLKRLYERRDINLLEYSFSAFYSEVKYLRRKLITKIRKNAL